MADLKELKQLLSYDPSTGIFRWEQECGRGPSKHWVGDLAGYENDSGYLLICIKRRPHRAHRLAYEFVYGAIPTGMEIDHVNGIRTDNRIDNLRLATRKQNSANSRRGCTNTSGYKGVYRHSKGNHWVANIMVDQKTIYLGLFKSAEAAHFAYITAATQYFGEYARAA